MTYSIRVTVSGGVTGTRSADLKEDGKVFETEDRDVAKAKAAEYRETMNHANSTIRFSATVEEWG